MNVRAKCINKGCEAYNVEKSVAVGTLTGYSAGDGRVKCPKCGQLMQTTKTIATTARSEEARHASAARQRRKPIVIGDRRFVGRDGQIGHFLSSWDETGSPSISTFVSCRTTTMSEKCQ